MAASHFPAAHRPLLGSTFIGFLLGLVGCRTPSAPESEPPWSSAHLSVRGGSILGGPESAPDSPAPSDPAESWDLWFALGSASASEVRDWPLLSEGARVVARLEAGSILGAAPKRLRAVRVRRGSDQALPEADALRTALATGRTARLELFGTAEGEPSFVQGLKVERSPSGESPRVAAFAETDGAQTAERVPLEGELALGEPVSFAFPGLDGRFVVVALEARAAPPSADEASAMAHGARAARADLEVQMLAEATRAGRRNLDGEELRLLQLATAFATAADPAGRRAAMVLVSGASPAPLGSDLALVAEDARIQEWHARAAAGVAAGASQSAGAERIAALAWQVEQAAWGLLTEAHRAGRAADSERALLLRHGGELAHGPSRLGELASEARSLSQFQGALVAEHRILLSDSSPSVRLRAHRWLMERGAAVVGFDPLGPAEERRRVLAEVLSAEEGL